MRSGYPMDTMMVSGCAKSTGRRLRTASVAVPARALPSRTNLGEVCQQLESRGREDRVSR
jgi:hypothetical protein